MFPFRNAILPESCAAAESCVPEGLWPPEREMEVTRQSCLTAAEQMREPVVSGSELGVRLGGGMRT